MIKSALYILYRILSFRSTSVIILALAVTIRAIQLIFFYNMRDDNSYLVLATQNLINHNGYSITRVQPSDLSGVFFESLNNWPPGYSFLLVPLYILFDKNYIAAAITLDIVAAIILIFYCRKILYLFQLPTYIVNIFTLLTSFFIYYFYLIASSDAIAISIFLISIFYTLKLLTEKYNWVKYSIIIGFTLFLVGLIKYLFVPVIFVLPAIIFYSGIKNHYRNLETASILISTWLIISLGAFLLYQKLAFNSIGYISQPGRGIYFEHLLDFYPFLPASLIKPDTVALLLTLDNKLINSIYNLFHLALFVLLLIFLFKVIWRKRGRPSLFEQYYIIVAFITLTITALLAFLSIRVEKEEILPGWFWTYIEEPRYYGIIYVLLHLLLFLVLIRFKRANIYVKTFLITSFILLSVESSRGAKFTWNRIQNFGIEEYSWQYELRFQKYADSILKAEMKKTAISKAVVTSSHLYYANRVSIYNELPILKDATLINNSSNLQTSQPVILLAIIREDHKENFANFLEKHKEDFSGQFDAYSFFTILIHPN